MHLRGTSVRDRGPCLVDGANDRLDGGDHGLGKLIATGSDGLKVALAGVVVDLLIQLAPLGEIVLAFPAVAPQDHVPGIGLPALVVRQRALWRSGPNQGLRNESDDRAVTPAPTNESMIAFVAPWLRPPCDLPKPLPLVDASGSRGTCRTVRHARSRAEACTASPSPSPSQRLDGRE